MLYMLQMNIGKKSCW